MHLYNQTVAPALEGQYAREVLADEVATKRTELPGCGAAPEPPDESHHIHDAHLVVSQVGLNETMRHSAT